MSAKRTIGKVIALVILVPIIGVAAFLGYRAFNRAQVDTWIGRQIVGIVESYIVPTIEFDRLEYSPPYSVSLRDVVLTAPDDTRIIVLDEMRVQLAERPSSGKPIIIESIELRGGELRIIREQDGGIRGLVPFVERAPGSEEENQIEEELRLSNVLKLKRVELADFSITYDDAADSQPMTLQGLNLVMTINADSEEPGWYAIDTEFGREPQARVALDGRVNLDTLEADITKANIVADVRKGNTGDLPPVLQRLFEQYDASGRLTIDASGRFSVSDPASGVGNADISLEEFNLAFNEYQLPIPTAEISARLEQKVAVLQGFSVTTLGGVITARGSLPVDGSAPGQFNWEASKIDLEKMLRAKPSDKPPELAGLVSGSGNIQLLAPDFMQSLGGSGELQLRDGRLVSIPIIKQLASAMDVATSLVGAKRGDRVDASFNLTSDRINITKSEIVTSLLAARGGGDIMYTGALDLKMNAGPLEKLQSMLGKVGDIFGKITDGLVAYRIRGTLAEPKVSVQPLGIGG